MTLTSDMDIPPVFDDILRQLKEKKQIPLTEFRGMLFGLRVKDGDIDKIEKWFIKKGIIDRVTGGQENKTRKDFVIFCFCDLK